MKIKIHNADNLPVIDYTLLKETQGELKDLTEKNYDKLKRSIESHGFIFPIAVWWDNTTPYILDGHQRVRVLKQEMATPREVPVLSIPAKDLKSAAEILLKITSQYGTVTQEGLDNFMQVHALPETVLPDVNFDNLIVATFNDDPTNEEIDSESLLDDDKLIVCPKCEFEFEK